MYDIKQKLSVNDQENILSYCISNNVKLNDYLREKGLSYENLRYRNNPKIINEDKIHDYSFFHKNKKNKIMAISFFSGAGGLDLGFELAGFHNLAAIEYNGLFSETLRNNFPKTEIIGPPNYKGNIKERDEITEILEKKVGITKPFDGVFHGGPPCQPFSIASNQRFTKGDHSFRRNGFSDVLLGNLLFDYVYYIKRFQPKAFLIENVVGLKDIDEGKQLSNALIELSKCGYQITNPTVINAVDFGVPQARNRLFIIGSRTDEFFIFPKGSSVRIPIMSVLGHEIEKQHNHITREHKANSIKRYMELEIGEREPLGRVDRLDPNLPSKTVIAGGTQGGGRSHLHPFTPRTLSVRECARLQTFPDNFIFYGTISRQFTQVGNAVPPVLAMQLANQISKQIFNLKG